MSDEAQFPVLFSWNEPRLPGGGRRKFSVPWAFVAPHEQQARYNHSQSLQRLAERGGLAWSEMLAVVENRRWHADPEAETKVLALLSDWQARQGAEA